jgi:hypothetical protein
MRWYAAQGRMLLSGADWQRMRRFFRMSHLLEQPARADASAIAGQQHGFQRPELCLADILLLRLEHGHLTPVDATSNV